MHIGLSKEKSENPKKLLGLAAYIQFLQRVINCGNMTKQRKGAWTSRTSNCGEATIWVKLTEDKDYLIRFMDVIRFSVVK